VSNIIRPVFDFKNRRILPTKIELVESLTEYDSSIACISMVTKISYDKVDKIRSKLNFDLMLNSDEIGMILMKLGFYSKQYSVNYRDFIFGDDVCIAIVHSLNVLNRSHCIVIDSRLNHKFSIGSKIKVYDPSIVSLIRYSTDCMSGTYTKEPKDRKLGEFISHFINVISVIK